MKIKNRSNFTKKYNNSIGILTFHWGTNYGGVLQSYALQTYLEKAGYETYIINYKPRRYNKSIFGLIAPVRFIYFLALLKNVFRGKIRILSSFKVVFMEYLSDYIKEAKIERFRSNYLNETQHYNSIDDLKKNPPEFDVYICGSDQIWNPFFTTKGEGKPTATYFLGFGNASVKKIAYAASFGCEEYPEDAKNIAKDYVKKFTAVSVREKSGLSIVKDFGFENPVILPDPTLLLSASDYLHIFNGLDKTNMTGAFSYFLRGVNNDILSLEKFIKKTHKMYSSDGIFKPYSIEEWLSAIYNAALVLTNSFHGVVFSIIFHKPFIVLLSSEDSSKMNDRFYTLLSKLNLHDRIITSFDEEIASRLINSSIDWTLIDNDISSLRMQSQSFFNEHLS